jgi:hypothetical protein
VCNKYGVVVGGCIKGIMYILAQVGRVGKLIDFGIKIKIKD